MPLDISNIPEENVGDAQFVLGWLAGAITQTLACGDLYPSDRARLARAEALYHRYVAFDRDRAQRQEEDAPDTDLADLDRLQDAVIGHEYDDGACA